MQNLYETLLIVTPDADDDGINAVIGDLRATIENDGGTVLQAGVWERRKLAYQVKGKTEGIYVLIYADGDSTLPAALKHRMKLDESVIRSMVLRLEDLHEADVRQHIAEGDHSEDAARIEAQRVAAERRQEAEAAVSAMSLDEIVAAEEAEAAVAAAAGVDAEAAAPVVADEVEAGEDETDVAEADSDAAETVPLGAEAEAGEVEEAAAAPVDAPVGEVADGPDAPKEIEPEEEKES